ncbi:MAG: hypothetical protein AAB019_07175 [Planctomycetota bacterium]
MKKILFLWCICASAVIWLVFGGCRTAETPLFLSEITKSSTSQESFQVIRGANQTAVGYLEEAVITYSNSKVKRIFYIYDSFFLRRGFVLDNGSAYRYDEKGVPVKLADYTIEPAVRAVLGYDGPIYFEDFKPAVRGLDF